MGVLSLSVSGMGAETVRAAAPCRPKLVVIDEGEEVVRAIGAIAGLVGFDARPVTNAREFREVMEAEPVRLALAGLTMADWDVLELLRFLDGGLDAPCSLVLMSEPDARYLRAASALASARSIKILGILDKPIRSSALVALLTGALADIHGDGDTVPADSRSAGSRF